MNMRFTVEWCKAAFIRALRTFAQTALSMLLVGNLTLGEVNWKLLLSSSTLAAIISILTSIVTDLPEVQIPKPEGTLWIDEDKNDISDIKIDLDDPDIAEKETVTLYVGKHSV